MKTRITLGRIESLIEDKKGIYLGEGIFRRKGTKGDILSINILGGGIKTKRNIKIPSCFIHYNLLDDSSCYCGSEIASREFIDNVEKFLIEKDFFLAEASFFPHRYHWYLLAPLSEKLKGKLYTIKE